jgi:hypothetical protein
MDPAALRQWVENQRAVAQLEHRNLATNWGSAERSITACLALVALYGRLHGWPAPRNPVDDREDLIVWERFSRLKQPYLR